jgi:hypothetical protein
MSHKQNQELIRALSDCAAACNHCATACLEEKDPHHLARCIRLDRDCADICLLTASFVARGSEHAEHLLRECAEICNACAEECGMHKQMAHCQECAVACRDCAEICSGLGVRG